MILFRADAIPHPASQSSGNEKILETSGMIFKSSTEPTTSTSLTNNIASEGELEQALSWVLNLIFQHENVEGVEHVSN